MKSLILLIACIFFHLTVYSQSAQTYFPSSPGFIWTYEVTPLDSVNNPISTLTYYQIDSFAVTQDYKGRSADYVLSKSGSELTVMLSPYLDTSYLSFQNNDGYKYYRLFDFASIIGGGGKNDFNKKNLDAQFSNEAFEGWFPYYKFAQTVGLTYQVFSKDTSITIDTITIPLRYELRGRRFADQTISTTLGNFTCKKFLLTTVISYLPLPFLPIPLYQVYDTSWIAQGNWIVKQITPSSLVDLSPIGFGSFGLPGSSKEIIPPLVVGVNENELSVNDFVLEQNYPNPFNPSTRIQYQVPSSGFVTLKVYDVLGNEVVTLVDKYMSSGTYETEFNASSGVEYLASGIYYYTLQSGELIQTKKMILLR